MLNLLRASKDITCIINVVVFLAFSEMKCIFQHIGVEHNVYKRRLDLDGKPLQEAEREQQLGEHVKIVNDTAKSKEVVTCGSCYGAETEERKCCNTCQEVKDAYTKKTWKFDPRGIEQCKDGKGLVDEQTALKEGCQVVWVGA